MLNADLADTPLASEWPDIAAGCDSLADRLREAVAGFIPPAERARAFAAIDQALAGSDQESGTLDREQIAAGILFAVYGDTSHAPEIRLIAAAALKRFGRDGRSYQAMGDEFGVTRACVHAHSRRIEKRTGIKCRSDKGAQARAISADRATGRRRAGAAAGGILRQSRSGRGLFSVFRLRGV